MDLQRSIALPFLLLLLVTACLGEHQSGLQEVMSTDCAACHINEAATVADPMHLGNFPQTCFECHATTAWSPSIFSHGTVVSVCYDCHRADYEATENPSHLTERFPQTCDDCHRTDAWIPALDGFHPNDRFPISSGPHEKFECLSCHDADLGPSQGGQNTDCIGCHTGAHSRAKMDDKHSEEPDYSFDENNPHFCLDCHPNGRD